MHRPKKYNVRIMSKEEIDLRLSHCLNAVSYVYEEDAEHITKQYRTDQTYIEMKSFFIFCAIDIYEIPTLYIRDYLKLHYSTIIKYANEIRDSYDSRLKRMIREIYKLLENHPQIKLIRWKSLNRRSKKELENIYL
jgi:replicative DNA helicase